MNSKYPVLMSQDYRKEIIKILDFELTKKQNEYSKLNQWGVDVCHRLSKFVSEGKMIRGSMVLFTAEALGVRLSKESYYTAASLELFHSALLIQDDFMDNDLLRRGKPSLFYQYQLKGEAELIKDNYRFGASLGICAADVAIALSFNLLNKIKKADCQRALANLLSEELGVVAIAQMDDVYQVNSKYEPSKEEIINLRILKSGRYTISLPMLCGATLAGADKNKLNMLQKLGEKIGLIFQLRDDELGIFGISATLGKSVGIDIAENKKTLHRYLLFQKADKKQKRKLTKIFGSNAVSEKEVEFVKNLMVDLKVTAEVNKRISLLQLKIRNDIKKIGFINSKFDNLLMDFTDFLAKRDK